jgi:hypothetical protein
VVTFLLVFHPIILEGLDYALEHVQQTIQVIKLLFPQLKRAQQTIPVIKLLCRIRRATVAHPA